MSSAAFLSYLRERRPEVEGWIEAHRWAAEGPVARDLEGYLYGPLAHYHAGGGKRVRPVLALLGAEAAGGQDAALEAALAEIKASGVVSEDPIRLRMI